MRVEHGYPGLPRHVMTRRPGLTSAPSSDASRAEAGSIGDALTTMTDSAALGGRMHGLVARLYPLCRGITGDCRSFEGVSG
jgi:hypothetical protein